MQVKYAYTVNSLFRFRFHPPLLLLTAILFYLSRRGTPAAYASGSQLRVVFILFCRHPPDIVPCFFTLGWRSALEPGNNFQYAGPWEHYAGKLAFSGYRRVLKISLAAPSFLSFRVHFFSFAYFVGEAAF